MKIQKWPLRLFFTFIKIFAGLLFSVNLFAQTRISGSVTDSETRRPITGVEIFINGNEKPSLVTADAHFTVVADSGISTATFIRKNYKTEVLNFEDKKFEDLVIKMQPENVEDIQEVILAGRTKKKYKNKKENPAYAIMQEVWKRRKTNGLANYNDYQYKEYEKIEIGLNNIDSAFMKKKLFNDLEFIFNYADSANFQKKLTLPVFFNETLYKTYGRNTPQKQENKIILANKFSGFNNNELIASTAKNQFKEVNLYDNTVNFFNIGFPSPAATDGFATYEYEITDSLSVNGSECFKIAYYPKRKEVLTFQGNLYISKDTYNIVKATLRSTNKINVNFVNGIYMEMEYDSPNDSIFLPKKTYTEFEMSIFNKKKDAKGALFKRTDIYSDYRFNQNFADDLLTDRQQTLSDTNLTRPDEYWEKERTEPLAESEKNVYTMVSQLEKVPKFQHIVKLVEVVESGYINAWHAIDFGDIWSVYGNNEVEGDRIRLGARTYFSPNDMWRVEGYTAYGFKDRKFKYGLEGRYMFNRDNRATIGFGSRNDVIQLGAQLTNDDGIMTRSFASSSVFSSGTNASLSSLKQNNLFFSLEPLKNFEVRSDISTQQIKSANPEFFNLDYYKNGILRSELTDFHTTFSLIAKPGAKYSQYGVDRYSFTTLSPTFVLKFTHGFENVLNGDFDYNKLQFLYSQPIIMGNFGRTVVNFEAGKNFNTVPLALQNIIPGNQSYSLIPNTFALLKYYEFVADSYTTLHLEHHFQGKLLSYIPLIKKLKLRELVYLRSAYGTLSAASKNINFENHLYSAPDQQIYYEYGFGFENIGFGNLKILRIDFNWRGNYLDHPGVSEFGIKFGLQMNF
ncbi:DUF5686 family protein [Kaistella palustris]|uniref:DUF5686 family protein n=1 Tax=Kaistella palustris TaxID=493376 RepID=UPI00040BEFE0|nr:DUF5686 family protein [Kaistella palustris]